MVEIKLNPNIAAGILEEEKEYLYQGNDSFNAKAFDIAIRSCEAWRLFANEIRKNKKEDPQRTYTHDDVLKLISKYLDYITPEE